MMIGQVQHDLVVFEGPDPILTLANIALDQVDAGRQRRRAVVRRRSQVVEDGDLVPLFEQELRASLADEAGSTGDQHLHSCGLYPTLEWATNWPRDTAVTASSLLLNSPGLSWVPLPLP